jgi:hypothetical protein
MPYTYALNETSVDLAIPLNVSLVMIDGFFLMNDAFLLILR